MPDLQLHVGRGLRWHEISFYLRNHNLRVKSADCTREDTLVNVAPLQLGEKTFFGFTMYFAHDWQSTGSKFDSAGELNTIRAQ